MDKKSLRDISEAYKRWVCDNPTTVTDFETILTWSSYFFAGRLSDSRVVSEVVYTSCKLLALFNDRIILTAYNRQQKQTSDSKEKIRLALTIIHYCEVFNEVLLKWKFGEKGKWTGVVALGLVKTSLHLILLYKYKQMPIPSPPIMLLQRSKLIQQEEEDECDSESFRLRSGRAIRRVDGSLPIAFRDWQSVPILNDDNNIKNLNYAETIHILKPLIHLLALKASGKKSWIPWLVSLGLDVTSLNMYSKVTNMSTEDCDVIRQRYATLLLYFLRSPMYDKYSKNIIEITLMLISSKIPFARLICDGIMHYLHHWQDTYFYMWA